MVLDTRPSGADGRDYLRHAVELAGILHDLAAVYGKRGMGFRVGLGFHLPARPGI
jgi:hypothetical protein